MNYWKYNIGTQLFVTKDELLGPIGNEEVGINWLDELLGKF